jgi:hypothetical protein
VYYILESFSDEERQFVRVLHWCWQTNSSTPVEIVEALEVRKLPECLLSETRGVVGNIVVRWGASSLSDLLRSEEEVKFVRSYVVVHYCAGRRVAETRLVPLATPLVLHRTGISKEALVDLLVDKNVSKLRIVIGIHETETLTNGSDLLLCDCKLLSLAEALAIENDILRIASFFLVNLVLRFEIGIKSLLNYTLQAMVQLFALCNNDSGEKLTEIVVQCGNEAHTLSLSL